MYKKSGRTSEFGNYPNEQWWLKYILSGAEFWFSNTMFEKRKLRKLTTLWYWGSDKGPQGWCIFLPNEELNNPRILKNHRGKMMESCFAWIQKANFERFSSAVFGSSARHGFAVEAKGFFQKLGVGTLPKINMEPENTPLPLEKEKNLPKHYFQVLCFFFFTGCTWRIIPISKWLMTMVILSPPKDRVGTPSKWPWKCLINGGDPNHLQVRGMILQVRNLNLVKKSVGFVFLGAKLGLGGFQRAAKVLEEASCFGIRNLTE